MPYCVMFTQAVKTGVSNFFFTAPQPWPLTSKGIWWPVVHSVMGLHRFVAILTQQFDKLWLLSNSPTEVNESATQPRAKH